MTATLKGWSTLEVGCVREQIFDKLGLYYLLLLLTSDETGRSCATNMMCDKYDVRKNTFLIIEEFLGMTFLEIDRHLM